jgi:hypothetical protein
MRGSENLMRPWLVSIGSSNSVGERSTYSNWDLPSISDKDLLQSHDRTIGTDSLVHAIPVHFMAFVKDFCVLIHAIGVVG